METIQRVAVLQVLVHGIEAEMNRWLANHPGARIVAITMAQDYCPGGFLVTLVYVQEPLSYDKPTGK